MKLQCWEVWTLFLATLDQETFNKFGTPESQERSCKCQRKGESDRTKVKTENFGNDEIQFEEWAE